MKRLSISGTHWNGFVSYLILSFFSLYPFLVHSQPEDVSGSSLEALLLKADRYLDQHPDSSLYYGLIALDHADRENDRGAQYESARIVADACFYLDDMAGAIDYYRIAAIHAREVFGETSDEFAARTGDIGYCFWALDIYDLAAEYYEKALELFTTLGNRQEVGSQMNNLGLVYFAWGDYNMALEYFSRTLACDLEEGDSLSLSTTYNNIGKVYEAWGYYDTAIEHYRRSMDYLGNYGDESRKSVRLSNIGTSYLKKEEYSFAIDYLQEALAIDKKWGNARKLAVRYNEIAEVYAARGDFDQALNYNLTAFGILDTIDGRESLSIVLIDLGGNYFSLGQTGRAVGYLERGIVMAAGLGLHAIEMEGYGLLSRVYQETGDPERALSYYRKYNALRDTVFNLQTHKQLANYQIKYETEKKAHENQLLIDEVLRRKRTQRTLMASGFLLLISSILLFYLLREKNSSLEKSRALRRQENRVAALEIEKAEIEKEQLQDRVFAEKQLNRLQREKHRAEIMVKNRELVHSTLQLVNKNEVLSEIRKKVKGYNSALPEMVSSDLLNYIKINTDLDHTWKSFKLEFEKLNPGFFDRIRRAYPDMSEQYIRLSAYLMVDLSSREIAQLMNVSIAAVNKNRQRLRKKMNLEPETDLASHLRSV